MTGGRRALAVGGVVLAVAVVAVVGRHLHGGSPADAGASSEEQPSSVAAPAATVAPATTSAPPARRDPVRAPRETAGARSEFDVHVALPRALPARVLEVPILMYHRVGATDASMGPVARGLTVAPDDFAAEMAWLHDAGYAAIGQHDLFAALELGAPLPPHPVLITFDDGYRNVLYHAAPVLHRLGMHATAYVITGRIGRGDPVFLTWQQLAHLEAMGVEIGSHTVSHRDLTQLADSEAVRELRASRRALEAHLHHPVQWLAYPIGAQDARVRGLAQQAGYALAVTTLPGVHQDAAAPFALRRLRILDTTGVAGLAALLGRPAPA